MVHVQNKTKILADASSVFAFISNFENLQSVQTAQNTHSDFLVAAIERLGDYATISFKFLGVNFLGRYEVVEYVPNTMLAFRFTAGSVSYIERYAISPLSNGHSELTHTIEGNLAGLFKVTLSILNSYVSDYFTEILSGIKKMVECRALGTLRHTA